MIRRYLILGFALLLLPGPLLAQTPNLAGIYPAVATPGSDVTIIGGPFAREIVIVFGDQTLQPVRREEKRLTFRVPQLPEGDYLLYLQAGQEVSGRSLFFRVVQAPPGIIAMTPAMVEACSSRAQREVTVQGRDLQPGVAALLDGVILATDRSGDTLTFALPELAPGMHQVQLVNPDGKRSLPVSLLINNLPEIHGVSQGPENVNYYELRISGKNFYYNSTLVVDGRPLTGFPSGSLQVDNITYVDCNTLIYKRYPPSSQPRQISLQVINPDGRESAVFYLTAP